MFFCDKCAEKKRWRPGWLKSEGPCEVCGNYALCSDVPSRYLPLPRDGS